MERSEFFGFSLPREQGELPNIRDHRALAELAGRPAEYLLYVDDEPSLTERVRRVLLTRPGEIVSLKAASNLLRTSPRSLTRHLAAEGTTFTDLRTDMICEAAARLLGQSSLPIAEIARQLGFAEAASFNRLFKRGTGVAPSAYRRTTALMRIDRFS
ncbi:helix-turn-helix domain-containing protein [Oleomonas cavernae]|uniref:helix-turn-helix domain-containing protein n=1 Tax=Oleomonas cavernae TaxID=2320859 RepID=UPI001314C3B0|nr:AraC family transcriptional regulator [Oleomonas cavernae]